jgi:hypothetical protein
MRVDAQANYLSDVLPGILVFGFGLTATVAPLTATALNSVEERYVGIASGINNGVSRVAGLLAIAVLGAVIAAKFTSTIDSDLSGTRLTPKAERAVNEAKDKSLASADTSGLRPGEAARVQSATDNASEEAFHEGIAVGGILMIVGGVIAGFGLRNPERETEYEAPGAVPAGECAHCPDHLDDTRPHEREAEPVAAT